MIVIDGVALDDGVDPQPDDPKAAPCGCPCCDCVEDTLEEVCVGCQAGAHYYATSASLFGRSAG